MTNANDLHYSLLVVKTVLEVLKENSIKITNERKEIIAVLQKANFPISPADLFYKVKVFLPKANLTTVYRNLEMLEEMHLVKKLGFNQNSFSYELITNRPHHHHIICSNCGLVEDLENISEKFVSEVSGKTHFQVKDHNLEFFGLCENCKKESLT